MNPDVLALTVSVSLGCLMWVFARRSRKFIIAVKPIDRTVRRRAPARIEAQSTSHVMKPGLLHYITTPLVGESPKKEMSVTPTDPVWVTPDDDCASVIRMSNAWKEVKR